ncbi:MAG: hypothetical protein QXN49_06635, partial [Archaeoglobaceae archaeon]
KIKKERLNYWEHLDREETKVCSCNIRGLQLEDKNGKTLNSIIVSSVGNWSPIFGLCRTESSTNACRNFRVIGLEKLTVAGKSMEMCCMEIKSGNERASSVMIWLL